jgi:hypothetical protein
MQPKDVLAFRRVDSVFTDPSLLVKIRRGADEIVSKIDGAHDRSCLTRVDVIMKRGNVPYDFVVTFHFTVEFEHSFVVPKVSVHYGIFPHRKADFDVLSEAIIDEYEFSGKGDGR